MKYGERLKLARGDMTQAKLSEIADVKQSLISQLENSPTATGSQYTLRLARALGISPDWLADEIGEMKPRLYSTSDPTLVQILQALEPRAEYLKEAAYKAVINTCDLVDHANANAGTETKLPTLDAPSRTVNYRERSRELDRRAANSVDRRLDHGKK